jgi:hypothetical protein
MPTIGPSAKLCMESFQEHAHVVRANTGWCAKATETTRARRGPAGTAPATRRAVWIGAYLGSESLGRGRRCCFGKEIGGSAMASVPTRLGILTGKTVIDLLASGAN